MQSMHPKPTGILMGPHVDLHQITTCHILIFVLPIDFAFSAIFGPENPSLHGFILFFGKLFCRCCVTPARSIERDRSQQHNRLSERKYFYQDCSQGIQAGEVCCYDDLGGARSRTDPPIPWRQGTILINNAPLL